MNRLLRALTVAAVAALSITQANAQGALLQGGPWQPGHVAMYVGQGSGQAIVQDGGGAGGGSVGATLSELGITARGVGSPPYAGVGSGPLGTNICDYDAPINSATGYHYLCLSANAQGGGLLAYGAAGTATPLPLNVWINGVLTPFGSGGGGSGTVTSVSVNPVNGFSGGVANATTTPVISISTTVTGLLQGNGTGVTAAATTGTGNVVLGTGPTIAGETVSGTANFTGTFQFGGNTITFPGAAATLAYLGNTWASGQCVQSSGTAGILLTTGSACGSGGGGTSPGGANTNVQFNSSSTFGGNSGFTYDGVGRAVLGTAGTNIGSIQLGAASGGSGSVTIQPAPGALGTTVALLPGTNSTDTLVTLAASQNLINKALTSPIITGGTYSSGTISSSTIDSTPVGASGISTGAFTTLASNSTVTFSGLTTGTPASTVCINSSNQLVTASAANCFSGGGGTSYRGTLINAVAETTFCNTGAHPVDPTGATDSTAGINACLTHYLSVGLPEGRFMISGSGIQMTQNSMMLIGVGPGFYYQPTNTFYPGGTILFQTTASGPVIFNNGGSQTNIIQGMSIDRTVAATVGGDGITYNTANAISNHILRDLVIQNHYNGITLGGAYLGLIDNVQTNFNYQNGIQMLGTVFTAAQWNLVNVASSQNNGWGFYVYNSTPNSYMNLNEWLNITTYANCQGGMDFKGNNFGTTPGSVDTVRIINYNGSGNGASDVVFESYGEHNYLMGALIEGAGSGGNSSGGTGYCGRGTIDRSIPASGNGYGVILQTSNSEVTVSGADIRLSANSGIATTGLLGAFTATDNHLTSNNCRYSSGCIAHTAGDSGIYISFSGIAAGAAQTSVVLNGNNSYGAGTQVYGVYNASGSTSTTTMTGNSFAGSSIGCGGVTVTKAGNIQNLGSAC